MRDYLLEQQKAKDEPMTLSYTYRSEVTQREIPNGVHRGTVVIKRGMSAVSCTLASASALLCNSDSPPACHSNASYFCLGRQ